MRYKKNLNALTNIIVKISQLLIRVNINNFGFIFTKIILLRLVTSFKSVRNLISNGHAVEAFVLMRFIQEQICYSYGLLSIKNEKEIKNLSVTKSIKAFKQRFIINGELYGELSKFTHLNIQNSNFYTFLDEDLPRKMNVILEYDDSKTKHKMIDAYFTITLFYIDLLEYIFQIEENNNYLLKKTEAYSGEISNILEFILIYENKFTKKRT